LEEPRFGLCRGVDALSLQAVLRAVMAVT
jgi:hypothetical protein